MKNIDPIVLLLSFMVLATFCGSLASAHFFPSDGTSFQFCASVCMALVGMLGLRIKAPDRHDVSTPTITPPGSTVVAVSSTDAVADSEPKP